MIIYLTCSSTPRQGKRYSKWVVHLLFPCVAQRRCACLVIVSAAIDPPCIFGTTFTWGGYSYNTNSFYQLHQKPVEFPLYRRPAALGVPPEHACTHAHTHATRPSCFTRPVCVKQGVCCSACLSACCFASFLNKDPSSPEAPSVVTMLWAPPASPACSTIYKDTHVQAGSPWELLRGASLIFLSCSRIKVCSHSEDLIGSIGCTHIHTPIYIYICAI